MRLLLFPNSGYNRIRSRPEWDFAHCGAGRDADFDCQDVQRVGERTSKVQSHRERPETADWTNTRYSEPERLAHICFAITVCVARSLNGRTFYSRLVLAETRG